MNIYEELNSDFHIQQLDGNGYIYYVPKKKLVKVKSEIAEKLHKCQENESEISAEIEELLNTIKRQLADGENEDISEGKKKNYIKKLELVVSTICNLDCVYCYANGGTYNCEKKIMPFAVVDSLMKYLKQNDIEIGMLQFFGGEPIMGYKTISYVCHKFEEYQIPVEHYSMVSNFTFLPEEFIEDIINYDIGITVSIDGPSEITNQQRISREKGMNVYHTIKENIRRLRNRGKDIKAIECTCTDLYLEKGYTKDALRKFLRNEFEVRHIIMEDAFQGDENLDGGENTYFEGENYTVEDGIILGYMFDGKKRRSIFCSAGEKCFAIFPDGNIYPCHLFALKKEEYLLGNVRDCEWNQKEMYKKVIEKIDGVKKEYDCGACSARNFCSQCIALVMLNSGKIHCEKRKKEFSEAMVNYLKNRCIIHI